MIRLLGAVMWLAVVAGCASSSQTPVEMIQREALQERPGPGSTLPPPQYMMVQTPADRSMALHSLGEAEKMISPPQPDEHVAPAPDEAEPAWLAKAREHVRQREVDQAVQLLLAQVRGDSRNLVGWRELARIFDGIGRRDTALSAWNQLLLLAPYDPEAVTASGLDELAGQKLLPAAERLMLARRLLAASASSDAQLKLQIAASAGLGLSLGGLGYSLAAATCFHEAAQFEQALMARPPQGKPLPRQGREFLHFAGMHEAGVEHWDDAARSFSAALALADATDATSLPPLVWAQVCSGRPAAARQLIMTALAQPDHPGRAGAPLAAGWLASNGMAQPLPAALRQVASPQDVLTARCMLAAGDDGAADFIFTSAPQVLADDIALREALEFLASRRGVAAAVQKAAAAVRADPAVAQRWAAALRGLPVFPRQLRGAIDGVAADDATRAVLAAGVDLAGFDSLRALHAVEPFVQARNAAGSAARIVALKALATEQDLAKIRRLQAQCDDDSCAEAAALSEALLECGETEQAVERAERAIELNKNSADAWLARAGIDITLAAEQAPDRSRDRRRESALEAQSSLERAMTAAPGDRLVARKFLEVASPDRGIAPDEDAMEIVRTSKFPLVQREFRREKALMRQRRGQSEAALEPLRLLFMEDPLDETVGQALVAAATDAGRLAETEKFLDALKLRHPAAVELGEADLSVKARQSRLAEAIEVLKADSAADPDSDALIRACVRSLTAAGRNAEAWEAMAHAPEWVRKAAGRSQLERIEFALVNHPDAAAEEIRAMVQSGIMSKVQRQSALALARQLPRGVADRSALLAALAKPLLNDAAVAPLYVAYTMLDGDQNQACAQAGQCVRAWEVAPTVEAAQLLVDEGQVARAGCLLHAVVQSSQGKNRSQLFRAELAAIIAAGDTAAARSRLAQERGQHEFRLKDPAVTTEAEDLAELGNAFLLASNASAAEDCFQAAIDLEPNLTAAMNNLAWLRMERNQIDATTTDLVKRAMDAAPTDPSTLDTAGWLAYRQGRLEDEAGALGGLALLHKSLELAQERASPESIDHYADALFRAGQTEEAQKLWRLVSDQGAGKSSRANVVNAFQMLQQRERGIRAWSADSYYDHNDGAAISRARKKLQAVAEGRPPDVAPMDFPQAVAPAPEQPVDVPMEHNDGRP